MAEALKFNHSVTELDLGSNKIGVVGARALAETLKVNRTLTHLDLGDNQIETEGIKALTEVLEFNQTLTRLTLRSNAGISDSYKESFGEESHLKSRIII
mmetsp:Transcript_13174/g.14537  ORF Transcript_13174/g.14537 Transcript_13174/m.14537 type:complete len:99 (-) Transcript_13174:109-405(-)